MENNTTSNEKRTGSLLNLSRSQAEWVNLSDVIPNPLNPRKQDSVKSEELQAILKKRGFEMPLTVYKKGSMYVVLSGHRRLYAARALKFKQIPVFVVEPPKSHQEEIERIASAQSGQVDWTTWEWARFTYERWISWGKPNFNKFSKEVNMPRRKVEQYCVVLEYYPNEEIEAGIKSGSINLYNLYDLTIWMKDLKRLHPELVDQLTEEMIRRQFVYKLENKKITKEAIRKRAFLEKAKTSDLKDFFVDRDLTLEEVMIRNEFDVTEKSFQGRLISIGLSRKNIKTIAPRNVMEATKVAEALQELQNSIAAQLKDIERKYPDSVQKEDIFTWKKK